MGRGIVVENEEIGEKKPFTLILERREGWKEIEEGREEVDGGREGNETDGRKIGNTQIKNNNLV